MKTLLRLSSILLALLILVLAVGTLGREGLLYGSWWFSVLLAVLSLVTIYCLLPFKACWL